jgi:hypothetical protein
MERNHHFRRQFQFSIGHLFALNTVVACGMFVIIALFGPQPDRTSLTANDEKILSDLESKGLSIREGEP